MNTSPNAPSRGPIIPVWYKIGAVIFIVVLAMLFFMLGTARMRHEWHRDDVPAGTATPEPGPVEPH